MSGGAVTWVTPAIVSIPVVSVFGRTGSVTAQTGDYDTSQVTESGNLYFTDTRAQNALSGSIANISNRIDTLSGTVTDLTTTVTHNYTELSGAIAVISNTLANTNADIATLSGRVATTESNISTLSGNLDSLS